MELLDLVDDVLHLLCEAVDDGSANGPAVASAGQPRTLRSIASLTSTCKRLRLLGAPFLYRVATIGRDQSHEQAIASMASLNEAHHAHQHIRILRVAFKNVNIALDVVTGLGEVLPKLSQLRDLDIYAPGKEARPAVACGLQAALRGKTLPSVQTLILTPEMEAIIPFFSNVLTVDIPGGMCGPNLGAAGEAREASCHRLISVLKCAPKLRHLVYDPKWTADQLEKLHADLPGLQSLGTVDMKYLKYTRGDPVAIYSLFPSLSLFKDLKVLMLAHVHSLNVNYHPPGCGNAYRGPNGQALRSRLRLKREGYEEAIARAAFSTCKVLEEVWFGHRRQACCVRNESGGVEEVTWREWIRSKASGESRVCIW